MAAPQDNDKRPIYAVGPDGQWVTDASGARLAFTGTAQPSAQYHNAYLCDASGNLLYYDGDSVPVPAADLKAVNARSAEQLSAAPTVSAIPSAGAAPQPDSPAPAGSLLDAATATMPAVTPAQPTPVASTPDAGYAAPAPASEPAPSYAPGPRPAAGAPPAWQQQAGPAAGQMPAPMPASSQQASAKGGVSWVTVALAAILVALLGVGAGWYFTHREDTAGDGEGGSSTSQDSGSTNGLSNDREPETIVVPAEAYPGAGEARIPSNAWLTGESDGSFDWMAPSQNIRCWADGHVDEMRCMIASWQEDAPEGNAPGTGQPADTVILGVDGEPTLAADGGSIGHVDATLLYDTTVYDSNRNWVCGAKENGITCWSLKSGHGFLIRRAGMEAF